MDEVHRPGLVGASCPLRENGLQVRPLRRFVRTTDSDHENPIFPNLAADMIPDRPNSCRSSISATWPFAVGFVYVAVILDAWSRRVLSYAISRRIYTRVTLAAALRAAVEARRPPPGLFRCSGRNVRV
jgi:putative transposase